MSNVIHSAETMVQEPKELWTQGLPERWKHLAFKVVEQPDGKLAWVDGPGERVLAPAPKGPYTKGTAGQPRRMLQGLETSGLGKALLYPRVGAHAYQEFGDTGALSAALAVYNDWILEFASRAPKRLYPITMLNVDVPEDAAREMRRTVEKGARGFIIPVSPGDGGRRYDQPEYEVLWKTAAELQRPISLLHRTQRRVDGRPPDDDIPDASPATEAAIRVTATWRARRSITAIVYSGVFERYPTLYIGVVGCGLAWAPHAVARADETYAVRPERTGPPTRMPGAAQKGDKADVAIPSESRSGTRGMAPEGTGYHFKAGERFSDHFKKNVFMTFQEDALGLRLRRHIGVDGILWGQRRVIGTEELASGLADAALAGVPADERERMLATNVARIYGFEG